MKPPLVISGPYSTMRDANGKVLHIFGLVEEYNALASANEKLAARVAELEDVALCCSVCGDYDDCKKCPHGAGDLEDQIQSERGKPTCSK